MNQVSESFLKQRTMYKNVFLSASKKKARAGFLKKPILQAPHKTLLPEFYTSRILMRFFDRIWFFESTIKK